MQKKCNLSVLLMELCFFCIKPSINAVVGNNNNGFHKTRYQLIVAWWHCMASFNSVIIG